jgi:hypothetical protein
LVFLHLCLSRVVHLFPFCDVVNVQDLELCREAVQSSPIDTQVLASSNHPGRDRPKCRERGTPIDIRTEPNLIKN